MTRTLRFTSTSYSSRPAPRGKVRRLDELYREAGFATPSAVVKSNTDPVERITVAIHPTFRDLFY